MALYPTPTVVVGALVDGKVNWLLAAHIGIVSHSNILVSLFEKHHTNKGINEARKFSINIVDEALLSKADYVGTVSGATTDKSSVFDYFIGDAQTPIISNAPVAMECQVDDIYKIKGFDNYICSILNTYAQESVLDPAGKINYDALKPVLFEMPTYKYYKMGEALGNCLKINK